MVHTRPHICFFKLVYYINSEIFNFSYVSLLVFTNLLMGNFDLNNLISTPCEFIILL